MSRDNADSGYPKLNRGKRNLAIEYLDNTKFEYITNDNTSPRLKELGLDTSRDQNKLTAKEVWVAFVNKIKLSGACQDAYTKTLEYYKKEIEAGSEEGKTILMHIGMQLGSCATPPNQFIVKDIVRLAGKNKIKVDPKTLDKLITKVALEEAATEALKEAGVPLNGNEAVEQMESLFKALNDVQEYPEDFLPIASEYNGYAKPKQKEVFLKLCCETNPEGKLEKYFGLCIWDPVKVQVIKDKYYIDNNIDGPYTEQVKDFKEGLKSLLGKDAFAHLLDCDDKDDVVPYINLDAGVYDLTKRLMEAGESEDKRKNAVKNTLAQVKEELKRLAKKYPSFEQLAEKYADTFIEKQAQSFLEEASNLETLKEELEEELNEKANEEEDFEKIAQEFWLKKTKELEKTLEPNSFKRWIVAKYTSEYEQYLNKEYPRLLNAKRLINGGQNEASLVKWFAYTLETILKDEGEKEWIKDLADKFILVEKEGITTNFQKIVTIEIEKKVKPWGITPEMLKHYMANNLDLSPEHIIEQAEKELGELVRKIYDSNPDTPTTQTQHSRTEELQEREETNVYTHSLNFSNDTTGTPSVIEEHTPDIENPLNESTQEIQSNLAPPPRRESTRDLTRLTQTSSIRGLQEREQEINRIGDTTLERISETDEEQQSTHGEEQVWYKHYASTLLSSFIEKIRTAKALALSLFEPLKRRLPSSSNSTTERRRESNDVGVLVEHVRNGDYSTWENTSHNMLQNSVFTSGVRNNDTRETRPAPSVPSNFWFHRQAAGGDGEEVQRSTRFS